MTDPTGRQLGSVIAAGRHPGDTSPAIRGERREPTAMHTRLAMVALLVVLATACGGAGTATSGASSAASSVPVLQTQEVASGAPSQVSAGGPATGKDACAALPRATIQEIVGADPGEGELEHAASSTICRYYGDAQVTVEIDPGAGVADARTSIEAYGDTCEPIDDIGDEALFCTGGFKAQGFTGQVVWTDGQRTYYVVYNFGQATPSKEVPLTLARRLEP